MWHDNESEIDLINVSHLAWAVSHTIQDGTLLPVTIGVFGDWGSGKSSLLKLVQSELATKEGYVCLWFNGWLFEGYEDAKVALIGSILEEIQERRTLGPKALDLLKKLKERVNWFNAVGLLGKAGLAYASMNSGDPSLTAGAIGANVLQAVPEVVKGNDKVAKGQAAEGSIVSIRQFRMDFDILLAETKITNLVVFIDDLDRCLPSTVIETLEALRLFLYTPRSAYVIAADDRMIELAVRQRFPEAVYGRYNIGRDYLEKLVQVPIRVPELSPQETVNYINLLFVQHHIGAGISSIISKLIALRKKHNGELVLCDHAWLKENCKEMTLPDTLADDFALSQRIGDVLAMQLRGNPRQIKRFLNTLLLRLEMSKQRGADLDRRLMAKLMVLEYTDKDKFRRLAELQASQNGKPKELQILEVQTSEVPLAKDKKLEPSEATGSTSETNLPEELEAWTKDRWFASWIAQEPKLAGHDLRPYFYVSRDAKTLSGVAGTMSAAVRAVYDLLVSGSDIKVEQGFSMLATLDLRDALIVTAALGDVAKHGDGLTGASPVPIVLAKIGSRRMDVAAAVLDVLRNVPEKHLSAGVPTALAPLTGKTPEVTQKLRNLLTEWSSQTTNKMLAASASATLRKL